MPTQINAATDRHWPQVSYGFRRSDWEEVKDGASAAYAFHCGRWVNENEMKSEGLWPDDGSGAYWEIPLGVGEWVKRGEDGRWPTPPPESGRVHVVWDDGTEVIWKGNGHCCGHRTDIVIDHIVAWCIPATPP